LKRSAPKLHYGDIMADNYATRPLGPSDHFTLTLPKLKGYKTLLVQTVIGTAGVVGLIEPSFVHAPPEAALTAIVTALIGIVLRLMTAGPVPDAVNVLGARPRGRDIDHAHWLGQSDGYRRAREDALARKRRAELARFERAYPDAAAAGIAPSPRAMVPGVQPGVEMRPVPYGFGPEARAVAPFGDVASAHEVCRSVHELGRDLEAALKTSPLPVLDTNDELPEIEDAPEPVGGLTGEPLPLERQKVNGPYLRSIILAFLIPFLTPSVLVLSAAALASCASTREVNAVAAAETVGQKAFATYSTFVALETTAAELVTDRRVPASVRRAIQKADAAGKPVADALLEAYRRLQTARLAYQPATPVAPDLFASPEASVQPVEAATLALKAAEAALQPHLNAMSAAVAQAKNARAGA
jgi:hypothetical protein